LKKKSIRLGVAGALAALSLASGAIPAQAAGTQRAIPGATYRAAPPVQGLDLQSTTTDCDPYTEWCSQSGYVRVTGSPAVGNVLHARNGIWTAGLSVTYQWAANGVPILGATRSSYVPVTSNLNKRLTVTVTGTAPGRVAQVHTSDQTSRVYVAYIKATTPVTISGGLTTGSSLRTSQGWDISGVTVFRQWMRNGVDIPGWQGRDVVYYLTAADVGSKISVRTTAGKYNYRNSVPTVSAETRVITKARIVSAKAPTIAGTAKAGRVLTATAGTWNVTGLSIKYQWHASGVAVTGASYKTYAPTAAQIGKKITVKVAASRNGYLSASAVSAATAAVIK
jgi:hypothetical protein